MNLGMQNNMLGDFIFTIKLIKMDRIIEQKIISAVFTSFLDTKFSHLLSTGTPDLLFSHTHFKKMYEPLAGKVEDTI